MAFSFRSEHHNDASTDHVDVGPNTHTAGSLLIGHGYWNANVDATVSDAINGSWTAIGTKKQGTDFFATYYTQVFYFPSTTASSITPSLFAGGGANDCGFAYIEFGYSGTLAVDAFIYDAFTNTTDPTSTGITTTVNNDLGFAGVTAQVANSVNAPFTQGGTGWAGYNLDLGTAGAETVQFTGASSDWIMSLVAIRDHATIATIPHFSTSYIGAIGP